MSEEKELEYSDNPDFNQSVDDEIGEINIYDERFLPSYVLFELKRETYRITLTEFLESQFEELKELVFDSFPALIAYNYRLSVRGPGANDPVKKFLHLKDAWEGAINIINALVFGEVRAKGVDLKTANVFHSGNPNLYFKPKVIRTDELKQRLENIRSIVSFSKATFLELKAEQISLFALDYLYELQDNRNNFSHTSTPTKEQAEEELKTVQPLFEKVLKQLRFLENVNIIRFESFTTKCRFETFKGHYLNKEYDEINLAPTQLGIVMTNPGEVIFARWDEEIFSLSPFLHFLNDATGHETYLCFYKGKRDCKYLYEPVKIRAEFVFDHLHERFDAEHTEIIRLLVP
ncbi:MAG: hypothetical protein NT022_01475 [Deltaproteobacteria bacterium]|nr:hypothetical protein [Deltaproteobacteria bacterium]